jgi:[glutamine synthetase] adenylyltransferase / [glutamine synthetase]-adenylyl-L-tyrosine phosphorylase
VIPHPPVLALLDDLKSARFLNRLSRPGRDRLDRLMPALLETLHALALAPAACARLGALLHAIARRSVYLAFLCDHPGALKRLLELFAASAWIADRITRYPILLDELLDPRTLFAPPDAGRLKQLAADSIAQADDLETAMEALRGFKNQQFLRVAASDVTGQFPVAEVSNQLTYIAEACLAAALAVAWRELVDRYGEPHCSDAGGHRKVRFAIIGYGKLGGWELGYGSDLDLVFVHDGGGSAQVTDGARRIENEVFFTRLCQRLIHILTTNTASGAAYEVDTRLRPSGGAGQLVTGLDAFAHYQRDSAWVWEHQALVRARAVAGDEALGARFAELRMEVLARPRERRALADEIIGMRARMAAERDRGGTTRFDLKHGRGGITDIEFMVQYAVLRWASEYPRLLVWSDNLRLLEIIADLGLWPARRCSRLHEAWFAYRAEIHRLALQQEESVVAAERYASEVMTIWDEVFAQ